MPSTRRAAAPLWKIAVRRACLVVAMLAMAVMVWTAAHDIASGEPDLSAEWTVLIFAGLLAVCAAMGWGMRSAEPPR